MKTFAAAFATVTTAALLAFAPGRAAADPAAIFVSDGNGASGGGTVPAYSAAGAVATGYTVPSGFGAPGGVAYNPANNLLYVADNGYSIIRTFDAITGAETQIGFANATGLNNPYGLALNAGVLYAANRSANTVTAYNAATGALVTSGFTSPAGLSNPSGLAVNGTTLFVANGASGTVGAFDLATGTAVPGFTPITNLNVPRDVVLYGNDLFVSTGNFSVGEYNATTGAVINRTFVTATDPVGLAILGNQLLVVNSGNSTASAYGIPDVATSGNVPTSTNARFLTGLNEPTFIAVVPEPSTWALLGVGAVGAGVVALRQRARA